MRPIDADTLWKVFENSGWWDNADRDIAEDLLDKAPTIDVEPVRHAKYIYVGPNFKGGVDWYRCSNCGTLESGVYVRYPFCSICGAKMDEGENV